MTKEHLFWRISTSVLLGGVTVAIISLAATKLPYSPILSDITDAASLPAMLVARIFYPEGVHTGGGAPSWGIVFMGCNILFYVLAWFAVLSLIRYRKGRVP
jgi:hypothetical protein